jgi:hypothetical protein
VTRTSIYACRDARGSRWQLGPIPPARGRLTLVGWRQPVEPADAGVPAEVSAVLARALTSIARVTFPTSIVNPRATGVWSPLDGDVIRLVDHDGIGGRVLAKVRGTPAGIALLSTRRPDTAIRLFDDAGCPWWLQRQVVLLTDPDAAPPDIDSATLLALLGDGWSTKATPLAAAGVRGIMRPGVDGDVAGLLALTDAFDESVLTALARETGLAGVDWAVLPETAFALR